MARASDARDGLTEGELTTCISAVHGARDPPPVGYGFATAAEFPAPLLLETGDTAFWSDATGEFLSAAGVEPVFTLAGVRGLETTTMQADPAHARLLRTRGRAWHNRVGAGTFLQFMQTHWK